jgi:hypothetical protein
MHNSKDALPADDPILATSWGSHKKMHQLCARYFPAKTGGALAEHNPAR